MEIFILQICCLFFMIIAGYSLLAKISYNAPANIQNLLFVIRLFKKEFFQKMRFMKHKENLFLKQVMKETIRVELKIRKNDWVTSQ